MTREEKDALKLAKEALLSNEDHQARYGDYHIKQLERIETILNWIDTPSFYEAIRYEEREQVCPDCKGTGKQRRGLFSFTCFGYFKKKT